MCDIVVGVPLASSHGRRGFSLARHVRHVFSVGQCRTSNLDVGPSPTLFPENLADPTLAHSMRAVRTPGGKVVIGTTEYLTCSISVAVCRARTM